MVDASAPEIVCLCGSSRFREELRAANRMLTLAGVIVLAPVDLGDGERPDRDHGLTTEQRARLGELHLRKIDLADRVLVVNPGGYVGESVRREIDHALATGTPVSFSDPVGDGSTFVTAEPGRAP